MVIDANVIAELIAGDKGLQNSITEMIQGKHLSSPDFTHAAVLSSLRKSYLKQLLTRHDLWTALIEYLEMPISRHDSSDLLMNAMNYLHNVSAYDALYVALAESLNCPLVTLDHRLARAPGINCEVIAIA